MPTKIPSRGHKDASSASSSSAAAAMMLPVSTKNGKLTVSVRGKGIKELDLSQLTHSLLPNQEEEEIQALSHVRSFDASRNWLKYVGNLLPLSGLSELDLSRNRLVSFEGCALPKTIRTLNISHNSLTSLGLLVDSTASLPCLTELDASHNQLTSLVSISRLAPPLRLLDVSHNELAHLYGVEVLGPTLTIFRTDHNPKLVSADELEVLKPLSCLSVLSFVGCPLENIVDIRKVVHRLQKSIQTLNGTDMIMHNHSPPTNALSLSHNSNNGNHQMGDRSAGEIERKRQQQHREELEYSILQSLNTSAASAVFKPNTSTAMSYSRGEEEVQRRGKHNNGRNGANNDSIGNPFVSNQPQHHDRQLTEVLLLLEQEQYENTSLRKEKGLLTKQLAESRRLLSEELNRASSLKDVTVLQAQEIDSLKEKLDRAKRDIRYTSQRLRLEHNKRTEELGKLQASHQFQPRQHLQEEQEEAAGDDDDDDHDSNGYAKRHLLLSPSRTASSTATAERKPRALQPPQQQLPRRGSDSVTKNTKKYRTPSSLSSSVPMNSHRTISKSKVDDEGRGSRGGTHLPIAVPSRNKQENEEEEAPGGAERKLADQLKKWMIAEMRQST